MRGEAGVCVRDVVACASQAACGSCGCTGYIVQLVQLSSLHQHEAIRQQGAIMHVALCHTMASSQADQQVSFLISVSFHISMSVCITGG
jgi:hypothetical protein